jgi:hypothetical protein
MITPRGSPAPRKYTNRRWRFRRVCRMVPVFPAFIALKGSIDNPEQLVSCRWRFCAVYEQLFVPALHVWVQRREARREPRIRVSVGPSTPPPSKRVLA